MASGLIPDEIKIQHRIEPITMIFIAVLVVYSVVRGKK